MYSDLLKYQTDSETNFSLKSTVIRMFLPWLQPNTATDVEKNIIRQDHFLAQVTNQTTNV